LEAYSFACCLKHYENNHFSLVTRLTAAKQIPGYTSSKAISIAGVYAARLANKRTIHNLSFLPGLQTNVQSTICCSCIFYIPFGNAKNAGTTKKFPGRRRRPFSKPPIKKKGKKCGMIAFIVKTTLKGITQACLCLPFKKAPLLPVLKSR
jgi:hypothetical protein